MWIENGVEIEDDNKQAVKILKREGLYGMFITSLSQIPKETTYIVMSHKHETRNLYCQYWREKDEFGNWGYVITIIRNPALCPDMVRLVERKIVNNFSGIIHKFM